MFLPTVNFVGYFIIFIYFNLFALEYNIICDGHNFAFHSSCDHHLLLLFIVVKFV